MHTWTLEEFWCEEPPPPPYLPGGHLGQTWKVTPWGEFLSSEDGKKLIIHHMYLLDNVDALGLDVWGPDHLLQPSGQAHLILTIFSGRGGCISQTWKVTPLRWVLFLWGQQKAHDSSHVLIWQRWSTLIGRLGSGSSPTAVGSSASDLNEFYREGSCIYQIWKVSPWGEFFSSEDGKKLMIHPMYLFDNVYRLLQTSFWG